MNSHTLNEIEKRFEPIDTACRFCNKGAHSARMADNQFTSVYAVKDRTNIIIYSNVKFSQVKIGISRCENCSSTHSKVKIFTNLILIFGVISIFVVPIVIAVMLDIVSTIFILFLMAIMFGIVYFSMVGVEKYILGKYETLSEKEGALREPLVKEFLRNGWSLDRPTA